MKITYSNFVIEYISTRLSLHESKYEPAIYEIWDGCLSPLKNSI